MLEIDEINAAARRENGEIKKAISSGESDVQKFYNDAVVFITGGSGFIGKQLIQKLIWSCNIRKVYILLRGKKNKTIEERLKAILKDPVFDDLYKEQTNFVDKIVPIEGDTEKLKLGIDEKNWKTLSAEVNIIFHAAATTNFKEQLKTATLINLRGAREILKLGRTCIHLKSLVHVSTAYSHATVSRAGKEVKEDFYESPFSPPEILINFAETMDNDRLTAMISPIMKDWPNTYTFTKALAEELVRVEGEGLPICVVRPAIVVSAYREPCPGWVEPKNVFGPSGLAVGTITGILHTFLAKSDINLDIIPVDYVNNVAVVAAYKTHSEYEAGKRKINIYTVTKSRTPFSFRVLVDTLHKDVRNVIPSKAVWYCFGEPTQYRLIYQFIILTLNCIPAIIIDAICLLFGQKPRFFRLYKMGYSLSTVLEHFVNNDWIFQDTNTLSMFNELSPTDKLIYNCDLATVDGPQLVYVWAYGVSKFIIKEDKTLRKYGQRKQSILKIVNFIFLPLYYYSLFRIALMLIYIFLYFMNLLIDVFV